MSIEELNRLVKGGESLHLEFKHKAADPQKVVREIVAFCNAKGGILLIGVDDDGTIRGLKEAEEEVFAMEQAIAKYCKPVPQYQLRRIALNKKKTVLAFEIPESPVKPVYLIYNLQKKSGRAYFRVADRSIQASRELRAILKQSLLPKGEAFVYDNKVQQLMTYLRQHGRISLHEFAKLTHIEEEEASQTLITLTVNNVLHIHPEEQEDSYSLKE